MKAIKTTFFSLAVLVMASCTTNPVNGTWQYDGGVYNDRPQKASPDFKMQRTYKADSYEAFMLEGDAKPELYNSGIYKIEGDSILITSKFSSRPSQNTDVTIAYKFTVENDRMTTSGVLPNGMVVEEYWFKVK